MKWNPLMTKLKGLPNFLSTELKIILISTLGLEKYFAIREISH
jgi:hypothetical protein